MNDDLLLNELDPRLEGRECFVCGHKINRAPNACWVESPNAGSIKLAAHRSCINGMDALLLATRYQKAIFAALTGARERMS